MNREDIRDACVALTHLVEESIDHPYGPALEGQGVKVVGDACVKLCGGDKDKARTLWRLLVQDHRDYMPLAAGHALIRAANLENLVPDVTPPDPS